MSTIDNLFCFHVNFYFQVYVMYILVAENRWSKTSPKFCMLTNQGLFIVFSLNSIIKSSVISTFLGVQDIKMQNGKTFKMYEGYTYSCPKKVRQGIRYNCTQACSARLYLDMDGKFKKLLNEHPHKKPQFFLTSHGTYIRIG